MSKYHGNRKFSPEQEAKIIKRYSEGKNSVDLGIKYNCHSSCIRRILERNDVPKRRNYNTANPKIFGENHGKWKERKASYSAMHQRLKRRIGAPRKCEVCGLSDQKRKYEWANLTGRYDDPNDYKRMCVPCHRKYDDKKRVS